MVKNSDIIAIFNIRSPQSTILNEYVKKYREKYKFVDVTVGDAYASCVLTQDKIYLSSISSITLKNVPVRDFSQMLSIIITSFENGGKYGPRN